MRKQPGNAKQWMIWLVLVLTLNAVVVHGQALPPTADVPLLKLKQPPLERTLESGETHAYSLTLIAGEFVQVEVLQKGVDVILRLYAPDGKEVLHRDSPNEKDGPEPLSYIAKESGNYQITVKVFEVGVGPYSIALKALRLPAAQDHIRIQAETLFNEADALREKKPFEAQEKFRESLVLWRELGEKYWLALTLRIMDSNESNEEAAQLYGEIGDKEGRQAVLLRLGYIKFKQKLYEQARIRYEQALAIAKQRYDEGGIQSASKGIQLAEEGVSEQYFGLGDFEHSRASCNNALKIAKELGDLNGVARNSRTLGKVSRKLKGQGINTEIVVETGHTSSINSVAWSQDGKTLASGSRDDTIKLWDVASGTEIRTLKRHNVESVSWSPDGKILASGGDTIMLWDVASGTEIRTLRGHFNNVRSVSWSPDGKKLAIGSLDETVKLWDVASGTEIRTLKVYNLSVSWSPDGKILAIGGENIKLWDVVSGTEIRTLTVPTGKYKADWRVKSVSWSPDGKTLASCGNDEPIRLWDVASGTEIRTLSGHFNSVESVSFSPDGKTLASGSGDETIKLWDVASGTEIRTLKRHASNVASLAWSPDGKLLSFTGSNGANGEYTSYNKLWDVASATELPLLNTSSWQSDFSHQLQEINGKRLLVVANGVEIVFINYDSGQEMASLVFLNNNDWAVVTPDGRFDASEDGMKLMHFLVSGLEEGYAVVALEQMKARYWQPGLLSKLLGFDKTPLRPLAPFTGTDLFPAVEYQLDNRALSVKLRNRGGGMGPVAVLLNDKTIITDARPAGLNPDAKNATFSVDLKDAPFLPGQKNRVLVIARNKAGYLTSSRGTEVVLDLAATETQPEPELWAVVGGVSDYANDALDLKFAAKDAEDFAHALRLGGAKLFGAERVHLTLLSTSQNPGTLWPSKENFRKAFDAIAAKAQPGDVVLIYLSGHGVAFRPEGQDRVLYCYLTQEAQNSAMSDPQVRAVNAISSEELGGWLQRIRANKQVLLLDTCNAGAVAPALLSVQPRDDQEDNRKLAVAQLKDNMGVYILMGSAANKPSYETTQYNQGLLTYALLEGLKLNRDDNIGVSDLFTYAANRVPQLAGVIGLGGIQRPEIAQPSGGQPFPIARMTGAEREAIQLSRARPLVMRPRLVNPEDFDDTELEEAFIKALEAAQRPTQRGDTRREATLVYLDKNELPSAVKPQGEYRFIGDTVTVTLRLLRDKKKVGELNISGDKKDLPALAQKLVAELAAALAKLDSP